MTKDAETKTALKLWREELLGLSRQSGLIKFRAPKTSSLQFTTPEFEKVLDRLQSREFHTIHGVAVAEATEDHDGREHDGPDLNTGLHSPRPDNDVGTVARNLMRRASTQFLDKGLNVLYLAFGFLHWQDVDGTEMRSPLLLVPVQLVSNGPRNTPLISLQDDESIINPALTVRLKEFGIEIPSVESMDSTPSTVTNAVRRALMSNTSFGKWEIKETVFLAMFSFAKEAMYRDLLDNESAVVEHPIVRALATSDPSHQTLELQFDAIDPAEIDKLAPPELVPLVMDADSSQRSAVAASLAGKSFVMDGPPGTGKSQTIANMIGALLHSDKTVLFVSEKIAALDVVRNRLASAGLDSYLLELHSHKASRKEVAAELLRALDNVAIPPSTPSSMTRQKALERREKLNRYAEAMNEVRQPLNRTLHTVIGDFSKLSDSQVAPVTIPAPRNLSESDYSTIQQNLDALGRSWRPAIQGTSFLWREVSSEQSLEIMIYQAEAALQELQSALSFNTTLRRAFNLTKPSDTPAIIELVQEVPLPTPRELAARWLRSESIQDTLDARKQLGHQISELLAARSAVENKTGISWQDVPAVDLFAAAPDASQVLEQSTPLLPSPYRKSMQRSATLSVMRTSSNHIEIP